MDSWYADSTRSSERPATIAATTDTASVVPLSDIMDWADGSQTTAAGGRRGYGLRRVRSWVASTTIPTLPAWRAIGGITSYLDHLATAIRPANPDTSPSADTPRQPHYHKSRISLESCQDRRRSVGHPVAPSPISAGATNSPTTDVEHYNSESENDSDSSNCSNNDRYDCCKEAEKKKYSTLDDHKTSMLVVSESPAGRSARQLLTVFQVPEYMVEDYIWSSYRPLANSCTECLRSWGYVHSELGNILTHAFGLLVFLVLAVLTGPVIIPLLTNGRPNESSAGPTDYIIVYIYLAAVLFCLAASVAFHTLACHSRRKHFRSLRCDFIGILTLIVGSFIPVGYYGFLHSRSILIGYMAMFVAVGVAGVLASVLGRVEDPKRAAWRPVIFMGIAGSGLAPVIHGAILNGYQGAVDCISLWYVVAMALLYIVGTTLYAFKIPERYRPGKHDVFLHSHQIFHVFVVLAAVCHYVGIIRAVRFAHRL
ncbi:hypothetical protein LPJ73_001314 [Coemansia sp. RSA 2703]|nr:hypothetical protein LPJ73_001314 [Coemansia sp. RSA 2703]KAJ2367311.1 hypothetical protein IW150_005701 [Coemansia sp. RSA 2607]KAJ2388183.1 hypothetical protein GGI05_003863 [Coemansia sp. RSA 2603]